MNGLRIDQQRHGYVGGHQLLATSIQLDRQDQDVVDRLSDIGGQPGPNESVPDYLTGYPLPSGRFFAFARTWYDFSAPRAGCVLTHTLLVPTDAWSTINTLLALAHHHSWFEREGSDRSLPKLDVMVEGREPYPPTQATGLAEVCEALFLEDRKPIVWLTDPDNETVLRIVEALWPALRSRFAFQTFALKPRSKAQGLFDLMVAPRSARGRFSSWNGRRIDGDPAPRHSFTTSLVASIFGTPFPDLKAADPLGLLARDSVGDPAKLRLSILWNTLRSDSEANPNNTLGMLDVLSAAALPAPQRWSLAEPLFTRIFTLASSDASRAMTLASVALGKLEPGDGERLADLIRRTANFVTSSDPEGGLRLAGTSWRDVGVGPLIQRSVAQALCTLPPALAWQTLAGAPMPLVAILANRDPSLLSHLAGREEGSRVDWAWFASLLDSLPAKALDTIRLAVIGHLNRPEQSVVASRLFEGIDEPVLPSAINQLDRAGGLAVPELLAAFAELRRPARSEKLDALVAAKLTASHLRAALSRLLAPKPSDVAWLLASGVPAQTKIQLLEDLLGRAARDELAAIARASDFENILKLLFGAPHADEIATALILARGSLSGGGFKLVLDHYGSVDTPAAHQVLGWMIDKLVPLRRRSDAQQLAEVLAKESALGAIELVAPSIFELLVPQHGRDPEETYSLGLQLAVDLPPPLKQDFIRDLPALATRASARGVYRLEDAAYEAWATLVQEAIKLDERTGAIAADCALEYIFKREYQALLTLTCVSFGPSFELTLREPRRGRKNAENLVKSVTRLFDRNNWSSDILLRVLLHTVDQDLAIKAATSNWSGERMIRDALSRVDLSQFDNN